MVKKTKIVATLGLVSDSKEILTALVENGMNVARLNFSHGSHEWHGNIIKTIREISAEKGIAVGILADLQGPRIRTVVTEPVEIKKGEEILVSDIAQKLTTNNEQQTTKKILLDVENIVDDIEVGNEILIEDGLMKVVVKEKNEGILLCEVIDGGTIKNHKGVNIPDANLHIDPITDKDEKDLAFVLENDVDFVAMSFVSSGANIETLRDKMKNILGREEDLPQIIAKIERKEAIKNLDDIIEHTDAIMVARGDLGIEIEGTKVAILQKEIVKKSLAAMKPVIVATQMLDSMIVNPRPTRAEVSDVTNAVVDHADAVMLSGESASGKYPVESVRTMKEIIENTEASPFDDVTHLLSLNGDGDFKKVIKSAYELAKSSNAKAVVLGSASGFTARLFSHFRPQQPMLVVTHNKKTYNQLSLVWGIDPKFYERGEVFREDIDWLIEDAKKNGVLATGDKVVLILGRTPDGEHIQLVGIKEI
ncbi:MAG: Pyruvate kinase [Candidatus Moranbacteria bacterium GW2011_GWE1_36_7]|nr:MAG: Pyruvate kinase [Candidatus Moranbacteria bacterium GW2011_GWD2_36_12]KKQ05021.1 MAG: Pyruvate kinase [Candidatus Moranbacteria bacterium GW2011_GWE2_36_40]KKQ14258.1 MAG: Pyruvate kinase [Candidatus Moranbacteria bacterium GW2011_GWE1_36_7]